MKVRIKKNFGMYKAGQVFDDWARGMARVLIARGLIEEVVDPAVPQVEEATVQPAVERADERYTKRPRK
jgi:hypothetical protein